MKACGRRLFLMGVATAKTHGLKLREASPLVGANRFARRRTVFSGCALVVLGLLLIPAAQAQTFSVIHTFTGGADGADPVAGLTLDRAGNLYGTAAQGGNGGNGTVFRLRNTSGGWIFQRLYAFSGRDGSHPVGRVIFGPDGALYGIAENGGNEACPSGGCGTVFRLSPGASFCASISCPWRETVVYAFDGNSGQYPFGDLTFDSQGNIYGTTLANLQRCENDNLDCGTVYQLAPANGGWVHNRLYSFISVPQLHLFASPAGGLVLDSAGKLYGAAAYNGGGGFVYELTDSSGVWTLIGLHEFNGPSDGAFPQGGLILDAAGNLYGANSGGGASGGGTVYELNTSGSGFTVLYSFSGTAGPVDTLLLDSSGNLYGTTNQDGAYGYGSVFELSPSGGGWLYTDLYDFTGGSDGGYPSGSVALDANGNVFGTTTSGGSGNGTVWEITP